VGAFVGVYCDRSAKVGAKPGETIDNCGFVVFEGCPSVREAGEIIDEMENIQETAGGTGERNCSDWFRFYDSAETRTDDVGTS
jgi:hypothetical protein